MTNSQETMAMHGEAIKRTAAWVRLVFPGKILTTQAQVATSAATIVAVTRVAAMAVAAISKFQQSRAISPE